MTGTPPSACQLSTHSKDSDTVLLDLTNLSTESDQAQVFGTAYCVRPGSSSPGSGHRQVVWSGAYLDEDLFGPCQARCDSRPISGVTLRLPVVIVLTISPRGRRCL